MLSEISPIFSIHLEDDTDDLFFQKRRCGKKGGEIFFQTPITRGVKNSGQHESILCAAINMG
jgi:hypothetical protein